MTFLKNLLLIFCLSAFMQRISCEEECGCKEVLEEIAEVEGEGESCGVEAVLEIGDIVEEVEHRGSNSEGQRYDQREDQQLVDEQSLETKTEVAKNDVVKTAENMQSKPLSVSQADFDTAFEQIRKAQEEAKARGLGGRRKLRVGILSFGKAGGHYSTACAVKKALEEQKSNCEVEIIHPFDDSTEKLYYKNLETKIGILKETVLQEACRVFDQNFFAPKFAYQENGFGIIKKSIMRLYLKRNFLEVVEGFDILISTSGYVHNLLATEKSIKQKRIPIISIPTDPNEIFRGFYITNANILYFPYNILHIEKLSEANCPHYKEISGLPLRQEFADIRRISKSDTKKELGFDPNEPVVMVSFGSAGNEEVLKAAELLADKQCILMCAKNEELKKKIEAIGNKKHRVEGFVDAEQMAKRMRAADISIGKPGFVLVSEAIQCETIYISLDGFVTPQEQTSENFLMQNKLGTKAKIEELAKVVDKVLADPTYKRALAKMQNNGAQEVAVVVKDVLDNYQDWQDRLWEKRRIVLLKMGDFGGHHESAKAIKAELEKRDLSRWDIDIIDIHQANGFYHFVYCNIITKFIPSFLNYLSKLQCFFMKAKINLESLNDNNYPTDRMDLLILCVPRGEEFVNHFTQNNVSSPILQIATDFDDCRTVWVRGPKVFHLLGTNLLLDQAKQLDLPNVMPTSGMVIRQEFKNVCKMSKAQAKEKMGFDASEPVICVCYGSAGYYKIRQLADMLKDKNVIFVCGSYSQMKDELEKLGNKKHKILGYADNQTMATCLRASDVVIGKPGPGVLSEAWQCECVPICEGGDIVMTQEKACEKDIRDNKRGIIVDKFDDIPAAIDKILRNPVYKRNCSAVYNNSLTQVCDVIQNVTENYGWWQERLWGEGDKNKVMQEFISELQYNKYNLQVDVNNQEFAAIE